MTHTLALDIDYANEIDGCIKCLLTVDGVSHELDAISDFSPFLSVLWFVKAVAGRNLPSAFFWNAGGYDVDFDASVVADDNNLIHLNIKYGNGLEEAIWFDAVIERETIIQAFLPPIVDMSCNFPLAEKEWYIPGQIVEHIRQTIEQGVPLRSDALLPQHIEITIREASEPENLVAHFSLGIWLDDMHRLSLKAHDTSPLWVDLIHFFEKIVSGNLPAECKHENPTVIYETVDESYVPYELNYSWAMVRAESTDVPQNIRLKFFSWQYSEKPSLYLDEVVDRTQFVQAFVNSFSDYLQNHYQITPDHNGKTFDLRTLSLDKLTQS